MWEIASAIRPEDVENFLQQGYEPFAVTIDTQGERIWLKKELKELKELKESNAEIHSQQDRAHKGRSRRVAPVPQE